MTHSTYRPGAILVRLSHIDNGEARSRITLDTWADADTQADLAILLNNVGHKMSERHGLRVPKSVQWEILAGRTANTIERMEWLLNDCRNLLIDLQPDEDDGSEMAKRIESILNELDEELGL